jgi:hypothetical protein
MMNHVHKILQKWQSMGRLRHKISKGDWQTINCFGIPLRGKMGGNFRSGILNKGPQEAVEAQWIHQNINSQYCAMLYALGHTFKQGGSPTTSFNDKISLFGLESGSVAGIYSEVRQARLDNTNCSYFTLLVLAA